MSKIFVKAVEPCIFEDGEGHVVDMSHTEFYGAKRWKGVDEEGMPVEKERKPNPDKEFEVTDTKYWLDLITQKRLIQVESPKRRAKQEVTNEKDE